MAAVGIGDHLVWLSELINKGLLVQNSGLRKVYEPQLDAWLHEGPNVPETLVEAAVTLGVDASIQFSAAVLLRRVIDTRWPHGTKTEVSKESKETTRMLLLTAVIDDRPPLKPQLAKLLAGVLGRVARSDGAAQWPKLVPDLFAAAQRTLPPSPPSNQPISQDHKSLESKHLQVVTSLLCVLKELRTKPLEADRDWFAKMSSPAMSILKLLWTNAIHRAQVCEEAGTVAVEVVKASRRVISGSRRNRAVLPDEPQWWKQLGEVMVAQWNSGAWMGEGGIVWVKKHLHHGQKAVMEVLKTDPTMFTPFAEPFIAWTLGVLDANLIAEDVNGGLSIHARLVLDGMTFLQLCLSKLTWRADGAGGDDIGSSARVGGVEGREVRGFLRDESVFRLVPMLIERYVTLRMDELEMWSSDPIEFHNRETGDPSSYLRPAALGLLYSLVEEYSDQVGSMLAERMSAVRAPVDVGNDSLGLLAKEAMYAVMVQVPWKMHYHLPKVWPGGFAEWLTGELDAELRDGHPNSRLLHRRIVQLIGAWVLDIPAGLRPQCYSVLLAQFANSDLLVRLAIVQALEDLISDHEWTLEGFQPVLEGTISGLFQFMGSVADPDVHLRVLQLITTVVERCGEAINTVVPMLVTALPALWEAMCPMGDLGRESVLVLTMQLVKGLGVAPAPLTDVATTMIDVCSSEGTLTGMYVLDLWRATLAATPAPIPSNLSSLTGRLCGFLGRDTSIDVFGRELSVLESYLLFGDGNWMSEYGVAIASAFGGQDLNGDGVARVISTLDTMMNVFGEASVGLLCPLLSAYLRDELLMSSPVCASALMSLCGRAAATGGGSWDWGGGIELGTWCRWWLGIWSGLSVHNDHKAVLLGVLQALKLGGAGVLGSVENGDAVMTMIARVLQDGQDYDPSVTGAAAHYFSQQAASRRGSQGQVVVIDTDTGEDFVEVLDVEGGWDGGGATSSADVADHVPEKARQLDAFYRDPIVLASVPEAVRLSLEGAVQVSGLAAVANVFQNAGQAPTTNVAQILSELSQI